MNARATDRADDLVAAVAAAGDRPITAIQAERFLQDPASVAVVGVVGDRVLGYVTGYLVTRMDADPMLIVYDVGVTADHRRRGLGSEMIQVALDAARRAGAVKAWVVTERSNAAARALYRSTGAAEGDDDLVMAWRLDAD